MYSKITRLIDLRKAVIIAIVNLKNIIGIEPFNSNIMKRFKPILSSVLGAFEKG